MGSTAKSVMDEIDERMPSTVERVKAGKSRAGAIKLKCLDCCCGSRAEVRRCQIKDCPLFEYRPYK